MKKTPLQAAGGAMSAASAAEPIIAVIAAYRAGLSAYNCHPIVSNSGATDEQHEQAMAETYGEHLKTLETWTEPVSTWEGASAVLHLALSEATELGAADALTNLIALSVRTVDRLAGLAAEETPVSKVKRLGFELARAMDEWAVDLGSDGCDLMKAHVFPASYTRWPVSFEHVGNPADQDRIDTLFHEWRNIRGQGLDDSEEALAEHMQRYSGLQRKIAELEPRSVTDLAMQYFALTDDQSNDLPDAFEKRIYRMAGINTEMVGAAS
jgi:hypothetical protein